MGRLRIQYNAPVVLTFSLLSLAALLLGMATGERSTWLLFCVYRSPLTDPLTYVRLFGHVLGHAGYGHFISNIMLLLVVGPPLEEKYGSRRLLACIAITALVSGLVQFILFPGSALLGASGIVFRTDEYFYGEFELLEALLSIADWYKYHLDPLRKAIEEIEHAAAVDRMEVKAA